MTSRRTRQAPARLAAAVGIALTAATVASAQQIWVGRGIGGFSRSAPRWASLDDFDGSFVFCRGYYEQARYEDGGMGWWTDYPGADNNLLEREGEHREYFDLFSPTGYAVGVNTVIYTMTH